MVVKKEVVFSKNSVIIKIENKLDDKPVGMKRKPGGGRKKSKSKLEDDVLFKKLRMGEDVLRNQRQEDNLSAMKEGITWHIWS